MLQSIFTLFVWIFRRLENASTPSFQMCHSILDVVSQVRSTVGVRLELLCGDVAVLPIGCDANRTCPFLVLQTRCCVLMLDLDDAEDLVCDMFRLCFLIIK